MSDLRSASWDEPSNSWILDLGWHGPAGTAIWTVDDTLTLMVDPTGAQYCGAVVTPPLTDAARGVVTTLLDDGTPLLNSPGVEGPRRLDISVKPSSQADALARLTMLADPGIDADPVSNVAVELERGHLAVLTGLDDIADQITAGLEQTAMTGQLLDIVADAPSAVIARFQSALASLAALPSAGRVLRAGLGSLGTGAGLALELEQFLAAAGGPEPDLWSDANRLVLRSSAERFSRVLALDPAIVPASVVDLTAAALVENIDDDGTAVVSCRLLAGARLGKAKLWGRAFRPGDGALVAMAEMVQEPDQRTLIGRLYVGDVEPMDELEYDITSNPADPPESARVRGLRAATHEGARAAASERIGQHGQAARRWMACAARWAEIEPDRQLMAMALAARAYAAAGDEELASGARERIDMLAPGRGEAALAELEALLVPEPFLVELLELHRRGDADAAD